MSYQGQRVTEQDEARGRVRQLIGQVLHLGVDLIIFGPDLVVLLIDHVYMKRRKPIISSGYYQFCSNNALLTDWWWCGMCCVRLHASQSKAWRRRTGKAGGSRRKRRGEMYKLWLAGPLLSMFPGGTCEAYPSSLGRRNITLCRSVIDG